MNTRRKFLIQAPLAALVGTATWKQLTAQTPSPTPTTSGAARTMGLENQLKGRSDGKEKSKLLLRAGFATKVFFVLVREAD